MSDDIKSRWVDANGVKTHYWEQGEGTPLIALHGGGAGSSGKSGLGRVMPLLGEFARVLAPDSIGGFGHTDPAAPVTQGLLSRAAHTADFIDALCLDRVNIIGNSQGAWSGVYYAMLNPDRVNKIVIVSSLTIAMSMGIKQAPNAAMKALIGYDGTREGMKGLLEALIIDKSLITDALIDDRQSTVERPGVFDSFRRMADSWAAVQKHPILSHQTDWRTILPALTEHIPTLILWGDKDPFALPETAQALAELLPAARLQWIENAGHQVQTDKPEETARAVREFLDG